MGSNAPKVTLKEVLLNLLEDGELLLSTKDVKTKATAKRHAIKVLSDLGITDYEEIK